ncbi:hypothetical protein A2U01_0105757, partial [Trifolium medium]|nr:hypothetical protein [Trifolium medium]
VIPRKFKEGDLVLKRSMGRDKGGKMADNWEGPSEYTRLLKEEPIDLKR